MILAKKRGKNCLLNTENTKETEVFRLFRVFRGHEKSLRLSVLAFEKSVSFFHLTDVKHSVFLHINEALPLMILHR